MTDEHDERLQLRPTVEAYLTDAAVRTGVDALLEVKAGRLPPGLELGEVDDYLTARGAAELTRFDFAAMLNELWNITWLAALPKFWRPLSIDEAVALECIIAPNDCWEEGTFSFCHVHNGFWIYTAVAVTQHSTEIAFSVEAKTGKAVAKEDFADFTWRDDDAWSSWLVGAPSPSPASTAFKLSVLREAVRVARAHIEMLTS